MAANSMVNDNQNGKTNVEYKNQLTMVDSAIW